jgi:thiol:disulfide interchange protein DsbC
MRKLNRIALDKLPMDLSFVRVKGDGSRKLIIFSDADCPFCTASRTR